MNKIIINIYDIAVWLYYELIKNNIRFNKDGYPILKPEFILWQKPEYIRPFNHRNSTPDKSKTALCYFMKDDHLYKRLANLKNDLPLLSGYMGICGFDLSPRIEWDEDLQKFNILLSQMATIWLALQGIKIIPNFRLGNNSTFPAFNSYSNNIPFAVGALGCWKKNLSTEEKCYFKYKLLLKEPSFIYIYGKLEDELIEEIKESGIEYEIYPDFRQICKDKEAC